MPHDRADGLRRGPNVESLAAQQEWYAKMGMVKQKVPMERVVDFSFLQ